MTDQDRIVEVSDRDTTVAKLVEALGAIKTGRHGGKETIGLLPVMRRAAAEGLADLGFRYIEATAVERVVPPKESWMGAHAVAGVEAIDPQAAAAALRDINPELAQRIAATTTEEQRAALRAELEPDVRSTLRTAIDLDTAVNDLRTEGRYETAAAREAEQARERGE